MATLLHLDSSLFPADGSISREVTATFRAAWEEQHPEGTVVYRDLAVEPLPHLDVHGVSAAFVDPAERSPEQQAAYALRVKLAEELEAADAVLIGAPMYNFSVPSTLKAWLDHVIVIGRTAGESQSAAGTPVTVVASRGGSYAEGTPRAGFEYVRNFLEAALNGMLGLNVDFIVPELTLARSNPAMAELIELADASRAKAHEDAKAKAKALATQLLAA